MIPWIPFTISYQLCYREWNPLLEEFAFSQQATLTGTKMKIHEILPLCIVLFASGCESGIQINKPKLYPIFIVFSADRKMVVTHLRKFSDFISSIMLVAMKRNQMETSFVVLWSFLPGCILRRLPKISVAYVSVREGLAGLLSTSEAHFSSKFLINQWISSPVYCPLGWRQFDGFCYFARSTTMTW